MNITVIGCGNGGTAIAADLSLKGHTVKMLKTSDSYNPHYMYLKENKKITLVRNGEEQLADINEVTTDYAKVLTEDTELIIIFVQTNYHKNVIENICPYLHSNQIVLVEPGYFATEFFMPLIVEKNLTIVEAESSPIDCRISKPGRVEVLFENVRNPLGVYPKANKDYAEERLNELNYHFTYLDSVIEAALHNPNLIVHTVGSLMSTPRIEKTNGEYWMYKEVFTPSVWNIVESLDKEKNNVLIKLGLKEKSYVDACKYRNAEDLSLDSKQIFMNYALNYSPKGPFTSDSRFVIEDVPFGLVLLEELGQHLQVETKTCTTLVNLADLLLQKDFRKVGRKIDFDKLQLVLAD
ncbi:NAD/NADP octopine/nopaline dehydrogenase family protein [Enterococcus italicus]|uniref:NAD/NADP octopine/nopaline dehydrogenase, alpha-helical domain protein n=1 Tax=Enterococcus italicus (strain DSM 15952 / CCUG 50447 / LMG 22039 / TP 1.5) TaxID=888064 RepID=E6LD40_ENTI1|nr:NAD/NADP octopine/nopaline dehydrogenase family protein [Enterococcus italicus]EFU74883.1 NAD/NADP octopine/nopaline dehydrogenase, alpha-helical domain protein [Enterococcus italicus DSM 15952]OJG58267.1 NAD/NADP octopine/nopaline dehydrogenase [Enterococcus italicus DSM 15952]